MLLSTTSLLVYIYIFVDVTSDFCFGSSSARVVFPMDVGTAGGVADDSCGVIERPGRGSRQRPV